MSIYIIIAFEVIFFFFAIRALVRYLDHKAEKRAEEKTKDEQITH